MAHNKRRNTEVAEENDIVIVMLQDVVEAFVVSLIAVLFEQFIDAGKYFQSVFFNVAGLHDIGLIPLILIMEVVTVVKISGIKIPSDRPFVCLLIPYSVIELFEPVTGNGLPARRFKRYGACILGSA